MECAQNYSRGETAWRPTRKMYQLIWQKENGVVFGKNYCKQTCYHFLSLLLTVSAQSQLITALGFIQPLLFLQNVRHYVVKWLKDCLTLINLKGQI